MENKTSGLIKFLIVASDHGEIQEWERGGSLPGVSLPTYTPKALVAKQMARHIFKPLFNTVTFFACLLFLPLVKSHTSCHCLEKNVRGLWLPMHLLSSVGVADGGCLGNSPAVVLAAELVKMLKGGPLTQMNPLWRFTAKPSKHNNPPTTAPSKY